MEVRVEQRYANEIKAEDIRRRRQLPQTPRTFASTCSAVTQAYLILVIINNRRHILHKLTRKIRVVRHKNKQNVHIFEENVKRLGMDN